MNGTSVRHWKVFQMFSGGIYPVVSIFPGKYLAFTRIRRFYTNITTKEFTGTMNVRKKSIVGLVNELLFERKRREKCEINL